MVIHSRTNYTVHAKPNVFSYVPPPPYRDSTFDVTYASFDCITIAMVHKKMIIQPLDPTELRKLETCLEPLDPASELRKHGEIYW
jgi:hypothetical protein